MDIINILSSQAGEQMIEGASKELGLNKADATSALATALPVILGAMKNNAASPEKGQGLLDAILGKHANSSLLDNIGDLLNGGNLSEILNDGQKILGHLFGGQEEHAANAIGKTSGIDTSQALNLLKMAAPFIMTFIGKQIKQHNVQQPNDLSGLIGNVLGDQADQHSVIASKIQTYADNDDTVDTIGEFINDAVKKSGVIGKLFNDLMK